MLAHEVRLGDGLVLRAREAHDEVALVLDVAPVTNDNDITRKLRRGRGGEWDEPLDNPGARKGAATDARGSEGAGEAAGAGAAVEVGIDEEVIAAELGGDEAVG